MIDELYRLPGTNIDPAMLQKILSDIHNNAVGIEYVSSIPTKLEPGKIAVYQSGTATSLYIKAADGTIIEAGENIDWASVDIDGGTADDVTITGGTATPATLVIPNKTSDPGSPATGEIWYRTDL